MLALADSENYLAQEARHYTWLALLVLGSMWFFLRWMRSGRQSQLPGAWALVTIAMVHTHYISAFAAVAQGLVCDHLLARRNPTDAPCVRTGLERHRISALVAGRGQSTAGK